MPIFENEISNLAGGKDLKTDLKEQQSTWLLFS